MDPTYVYANLAKNSRSRLARKKEELGLPALRRENSKSSDRVLGVNMNSLPVWILNGTS